MLSKETSSTILEYLVWLGLELNPGLLGHWRTLYPTRLISKHSSLVISFLNELELICFNTIIAIVSTQLNCFNYCNLTPIILFNCNHLFSRQWNGLQFNTNFIEHKSIICTQYCYVVPIFQLRYTVKKFQVLLCITNNSIKQQSLFRVKWSTSSISNNSTLHKLFVCPQFKCQIIRHR